MLKQIIDISHKAVAVIIASVIIISSSYHTSMIILEPQSAPFKICKNRLALVLNTKAPISQPSKTDNTTKSDFGSAFSFSYTSLFFPFMNPKKSVEHEEPSSNSIFHQPFILSGFANKVLRPPRF